MGHKTNFSRTRGLAALLMTSVLATAAVMPDVANAAAQPKQKAPAAAADPATQSQQAAAAAHASYDSGIKSYQTGKFEPAVQSFTAALRGGGLPSTDMAHALYYRGLSYKKQNKPGLAISDLTSALWLKNGLSDSERASATSERAEAYRLAGLGDGNSGNETVAVADPNVASAPARPAPAAAAAAQSVAAAPKPAVARVESQQAMPDGTFGVAPGTSETVARTATAAPAPRSADHGAMQTAALNQNEPLPSAAATPAQPAALAEAAPQSSSGGSSTVSGFFSDLFGSAKSAAPAPVAAPVTTASTGPVAAAPGRNDATGAVSVASGKKATTATTAAGPVAVPAPIPAAAATAAPAPAPQAAAPQAPAPQVKGGKYKIHIAAMRSRAEAEALAQKLAQQHGAALASRTPTVDEAVIGSMGTFYRVRVGSFATADEPRGLCNTLRTSGYDCLVVTN